MAESGTQNSAAPSGPTLNRELSYYAVLFLDLLGQREAIASLENLKLLRDDEAEYYHRFGRAAAGIWGVRCCLIACMEREMRAAIGSVAYTVPHITLQMFSDTLMVYFPWDQRNPNGLIALRSLLLAAAETMINALASGIPIRGGLEAHTAIEFNEQVQGENFSSAIFHGGDLWGPAPQKAYELAEENDSYMRVRVGAGVPALIDQSAEHIKKELDADPNTSHAFVPIMESAKRIVELLAPDPVDNTLIIDYFGKAVGERFDAADVRERVGAAVDFARREYERFKLDREASRVADKYKRLLQYAEARQIPNGMVPPLAGI